MSEQLTALDATFLELEEADDSAHMHIGGLMVFEAGDEGAPPARRGQEHAPGAPGRPSPLPLPPVGWAYRRAQLAGLGARR